MPLFTSDVSVDSTVGLTDAELRATPVLTDGSGVVQPVSGTVTANAGTGTLLVDGSAHTQPVSGTVTATGPLTDAQLRATPVPISGTVSTTALVATTSNITQVVLTNNTNATLLAINSARIKAIIFVPSATLQIKLGATASTTSFTYKITSNSSTIEITGYTGRIDAFGSGQTVTITELS